MAKTTHAGLTQGPRLKDRVVVNRLGGFALFALTHLGWSTLGMFDENLYPAYGEDVEYHIRAVSLGLGGPRQFPITGNNKEGSDYYHVHAINQKSGSISYDPKAMQKYMYKKWGVQMQFIQDFAISQPYFQPWNKCGIQHNDSWIVDWVYRDCLKRGMKAGPPPFNCDYPALELTDKLKHPQPSHLPPCQRGKVPRQPRVLPPLGANGRSDMNRDPLGRARGALPKR